MARSLFCLDETSVWQGYQLVVAKVDIPANIKSTYLQIYEGLGIDHSGCFCYLVCAGMWTS